MLVVMWIAASKIGGKSSVYFIKQQDDIGMVNSYIEEMMDGQKVVKAFCHEEQSIEDFDKVNAALRDSSNQANKLANILMPVNANLSQVSYVLCAVVGAALALSGSWGLTLGTLVSFLNLNRNFTQPVTQISQQINNVIMALAGAERIFEMLDEPSEEDQGYVELVNAKEQPDGTVVETSERIGVWAWKHPHKADGTVTYVRQAGDVVFEDVDFGYDDSKMILHDIKLYAKPGQKLLLSEVRALVKPRLQT